MAEMLREGTVLLGDHRIAYRLTGGEGGGARTVALLNGSVFNCRQWNPVLLPLLRWRLGPTWRFLQFDYPGFGRSPAGPPLRTMAASAAVVARLLDALCIERAHFLGISLGSALGQALLFEHPQRVLSFAGFGNPHLGDEAYARKVTAFHHHLQALERIRHLWDTPVDFAMVGRLLREVYCEGIYGKPADRLTLLERAKLRAIQLLVAPMLIGTPLCSMVELFSLYANDPDPHIEYYRSRLLSAPAVPVLLLCGLDDTTTPPEMCRALHRALPAATLVELPGVDHMGPMLMPHQAWRIVAAYATWVRRLAATSGRARA
jgi:pimeloyl-ACP methyl ester carboxylesterase